MRRLSAVLEPHKIVLVLEPLNWPANHDGTCLSRSDQAYALCKAVHRPSCKILFDLYHPQITGGNLIPNLDACWDEIAYLQSSDHPGRKESGTGEIRAAAMGRNGAHGPAATRIALTLESPPRHRLKTTAHRNLASSRDRHVRQNLNLVLPKKSAAPLPLVSWVHRGGWQSGRKDPCLTLRSRPLLSRRPTPLEPRSCHAVACPDTFVPVQLCPAIRFPSSTLPPRRPSPLVCP